MQGIEVVRVGYADTYTVLAYEMFPNVWHSDVDGIEYVIYDKAGKEIVRDIYYADGSFQSGIKLPDLTDKYGVYKIQVRPFKRMAATKVWGKWNETVFVSTPDKVMRTKTVTDKKDSDIISWPKVTGAKKYIVYCSDKKDSGFKKVCTTKKTSIKTEKLTKKDLDINSTAKYIKIVAVAKVDGKTYKSSSTSVSTLGK